MVVQDERVRIAKSVIEEKPPEVLGFSVRASEAKGRTRERIDKSHLTCTHCKKPGMKLQVVSNSWGIRNGGKIGANPTLAIVEEGQPAEAGGLEFMPPALTMLVLLLTVARNLLLRFCSLQNNRKP